MELTPNNLKIFKRQVIADIFPNLRRNLFSHKTVNKKWCHADNF